MFLYGYCNIDFLSDVGFAGFGLFPLEALRLGFSLGLICLMLGSVGVG